MPPVASVVKSVVGGCVVRFVAYKKTAELYFSSDCHFSVCSCVCVCVCVCMWVWEGFLMSCCGQPVTVRKCILKLCFPFPSLSLSVTLSIFPLNKKMICVVMWNSTHHKIKKSFCKSFKMLSGSLKGTQ